MKAYSRLQKAGGGFVGVGFAFLLVSACVPSSEFRTIFKYGPEYHPCKETDAFRAMQQQGCFVIYENTLTFRFKTMVLLIFKKLNV